MKYFRYFLILGLAFISLASNTTGTTQPSEGIYPGDQFPDMKNIENVSGAKIDLLDLKGKKVLVNFWAANDADSRKDNVLLSNIISRKKYPVQMVSVSFDRSEAVFERTVSVDRIDKTNQFWANGKVQSELYKRYQLDKGYKSYLIDEQGRIIAVNLTPQSLDRLMKEI